MQKTIAWVNWRNTSAFNTYIKNSQLHSFFSMLQVEAEFMLLMCYNSCSWPQCVFAFLSSLTLNRIQILLLNSSIADYHCFAKIPEAMDFLIINCTYLQPGCSNFLLTPSVQPNGLDHQYLLCVVSVWQVHLFFREQCLFGNCLTLFCSNFFYFCQDLSFHFLTFPFIICPPTFCRKSYVRWEYQWIRIHMLYECWNSDRLKSHVHQQCIIPEAVFHHVIFSVIPRHKGESVALLSVGGVGQQ